MGFVVGNRKLPESQGPDLPCPRKSKKTGQAAPDLVQIGAVEVLSLRETLERARPRKGAIFLQGSPIAQIVIVV